MVELYTELFDDVIDANSIGDAAMFSTVAWSMYSLTGFVFTPILATLSDSIGRKPVLLYCAIVVGITGIAAGLFPSNWVFISMLCLQGTGAGTVAIGYALLADYEALIPENWTGCTEDDIFHQYIFAMVRYAFSPQPASTTPDGGLSFYAYFNLSTLFFTFGHIFPFMWVCGVDVARDSTIELNVLFNYVLVLKTVGLLLGVLMGDFLYDYTNSLTWSLSCSGFLCLPMIPTFFLVCA